VKTSSENTHVLFGVQGDPPRNWSPATREQLGEVVKGLQETIGPDESLWVLVLAHAHGDGRRAWLHLAGPDLHDGQWAALFADIPCRRQVFWMTHSSSGAFLQSLSRPGRVVVAAMAPGMADNETEMPQALAAVVQKPAGELDRNGDAKVSLAELFARIDAEVKSIYQSDRRAPTEEAVIDDNGDGRATTAADLIEFVLDRPASTPSPDRLASGHRIDGAVSEGWIVLSNTEPSPSTSNESRDARKEDQ
jgi:hypothetical protein